MVRPFLMVQGTFNILGRLPVYSRLAGLNTTALPGVGREVIPGHLFWGLCTVTVDFRAVIAQSGIDQQDAYLYNLTRSDTTLPGPDGSGGGVNVTMSVSSSDASRGTITDGETVALEVVGMVWTLSLEPPGGFRPTWVRPAAAAAVAACAALALMAVARRAARLGQKEDPAEALLRRKVRLRFCAACLPAVSSNHPDRLSLQVSNLLFLSSLRIP